MLYTKYAKSVMCFLGTSASILLWIISHDFQNKNSIATVIKGIMLLSGDGLILFCAVLIPLWI